jgi:hypothetical protein
MKDRILFLLRSSLHEVAFFSAVLGIVLYQSGDQSAAPRSAGHPAGCHLCAITPRGAAAARDEFLLKDGAIEMVEPPTSDRFR